MLLITEVSEVENYINATIIVCICSVKNLVANYLKIMPKYFKILFSCFLTQVM